MADKYYYNGVLLPEIPADVLAVRPYYLIRDNNDSGYYDLLCSTSKFVYDTNGEAIKSDTFTIDGIAWYRVLKTNAASAKSWDIYNGNFTLNGSLSAPTDTRPIIWANHGVPYDSSTSGLIHVPKMKAYRAVDVFTPDTVAISKERMVGIADQARRLGSVEGELTPEQIQAALSEANGFALAMAEEASFGAAQQECGIASYTSISSVSSGNTLGWQFTPTEDILVHGLRSKDGPKFTVYLWDNSGNTLASATPGDTEVDGWYTMNLDTPVKLTAGETYVVGSRTTYQTYPLMFADVSKVAFNEKISNIAGRTDKAGDIFPEAASTYVGAVDIVFAPNRGRADSYEIQTETMDTIATEVQRLSGATELLTPAQIVGVLETATCTTLPAFPADVLATYPYLCMIINGNIFAGSVKPYFVSLTDYPKCLKCDGPCVQYGVVDGVWTLQKTYESLYTVTSGIKWTNYHMPNGSASSSNIYHKAGSLVPVL